ncbi:hypothetical protein H1C71_027243 [Ictidomys tridecemlineatus]|nr:hypothetical protein H1C71_027243 [Ictidomys tridecemlineatus]
MEQGQEETAGQCGKGIPLQKGKQHQSSLWGCSKTSLQGSPVLGLRRETPCGRGARCLLRIYALATMRSPAKSDLLQNGVMEELDEQHLAQLLGFKGSGNGMQEQKPS